MTPPPPTNIPHEEMAAAMRATEADRTAAVWAHVRLAIEDNEVAAVYALVGELATLPSGVLLDVYDELRAAFGKELHINNLRAKVKDAQAQAKTPANIGPWAGHLITSTTGIPKPVLANAITALRLAPEWKDIIAYDAFSLTTQSMAAPPWVDTKKVSWTKGPWTDQEDRLAANWLQHAGILVSVDVAAEAIQTVAQERAFHPVRQYLRALKWDGVKRLDTWLDCYLGAEASDYTQAIGARWMISAVARIFKPGSKVDCCLILEGEQGTLKSTALRTLAPQWFTDEIADLGSKDASMQTRGVWIIELAELDSMTRGEVSRIKAFMSRATDRFRPPYGRRLVDSPRQCVFAGSVNHTTYLRDETGARRFWPVTCSVIRIKDLIHDRDQLWAEAVTRFRAGCPWWLDSRELNLRAFAEQAARYEADPWEEPLMTWLANPMQRFDPKGSHPVVPWMDSERNSVVMADILLHCLGKPEGTWSQTDKNRVGRCLRSLGWEPYRKRVRVEVTNPEGNVEIADKVEWRFRRKAGGTFADAAR